MRRGWLVAGMVFLALFVATAYLASKLPLIDVLGPGPGFFPLILAVIGAVLSLVLIAQHMRRTPAADPSVTEIGEADSLIPDRAAIGRLVGVIVLLAAACIALDPLGYRLTALVFTVTTLVVLGARNLPVIAVVSLCLSFGVFHAFFYWLKVPLPIGGFGL